ncbi:hypothetical protein V4R08_06330 [Nitrobacter sp. NHB1]|uniref:hypothetical protein n=1 Tax=Nitrobacter sp. NHB1 TaxID=3119830 RepID=UPI003000BC61
MDSIYSRLPDRNQRQDSTGGIPLAFGALSPQGLAATFEGEFSDTNENYAGKGVVRYSW